jgi:acyl carrier protein
MKSQEVMGQIEKIIAGLVSAKGLKPPTIDANTELIGGGIAIDSLDLASLVRELEDVTGHDPFREGFIEFRTAGELAKLYEQ